MQTAWVARLSRFVFAGVLALAGFVICTALLADSSHAEVGPVEGTLDPTFGDGGLVKTQILGELRQMRVLAGGEIVVVVLFPDGRYECDYRPPAPDCQDIISIARFRPNGTIDSQYGLAGRLILTGSRWNQDTPLPNINIDESERVQAFSQKHLTQFDPLGKLDNRFGVNGVVTFPITSAISDSAQRSYIKLLSDDFLINFENALARFRFDGTLDQSFGNQGIFQYPAGGDGATYECVMPRPDGKIVIGGHTGTSTSPGIWRDFMVRLLPNGTLDSNFNNVPSPTLQTTNHSDRPSALAQDMCPIGYVGDNLIVNAEDSNPGRIHQFVGLYTDNGQFIADTDQLPIVKDCFTSGGWANTLQASHIQNDGKILVYGYCYNHTSGNFAYTGRLSADLTMDTTYGKDGIITQTMEFSTHYSVLQKDDRGLEIMPQYPSYPLGNRIQITRYLTSGELDPSFNGGSTSIIITDVYNGISGTVVVTDSYARALGVQMDGQIIVGGTYYDGHELNWRGDPYLVLARLNGTPITIVHTYMPVVAHSS